MHRLIPSITAQVQLYSVNMAAQAALKNVCGTKMNCESLYFFHQDSKPSCSATAHMMVYDGI